MSAAAMNALPHQWSITAAVEDTDSTALICPHCGEDRMLQVGVLVTLKWIRVDFRCSSIACATPAALVVACHPNRSNVTWEWRPAKAARATKAA